MSSSYGQSDQPQRGERGSIMIMTAIFALLLLLMVGLCIDISRIYMVRAELQNGADAAALTAARELNSGGGGIDNAVARAKAIVNSKGFGKTNISVATVSFAVNLNDNPYPYLAYDSNNPAVNTVNAKAHAASIRFVKVTTQPASTNILFASSALGASHAESREAVAGASVPINTICDFFPIVVALDPAVQPGDDPLTGYPLPNTAMTLQFVQGDPGANTISDQHYILIDVPEISGNGEKETVLLAAGVTSICETLNANIPFHITPSANKSNGPKAIAWGTNSRFDNPGKGYVDAATYPPDTNVQGNITFDQYINRTPGYVTSPPKNPPGKDERRILIVPIITPGTYQASPGPPTVKFGAFFLKSQVPNSADLSVEWIDETLVLGEGSVNGCSSNALTLPVLYK